MKAGYPGANITDVAKGMVFMLDSFKVAFKHNSNIGVVVNTHMQLMNKLLGQIEVSERDLDGVNDGKCSGDCSCSDNGGDNGPCGVADEQKTGEE